MEKKKLVPFPLPHLTTVEEEAIEEEGIFDFLGEEKTHEFHFERHRAETEYSPEISFSKDCIESGTFYTTLRTPITTILGHGWMRSGREKTYKATYTVPEKGVLKSCFSRKARTEIVGIATVEDGFRTINEGVSDGEKVKIRSKNPSVVPKLGFVEILFEYPAISYENVEERITI